MKKFFILALVLSCSSLGFSHNYNLPGNNSFTVDNTTKVSEIEEGYPEDPIPYVVLSYLEKNYNNYYVLVSKREANGNLYLKVKCQDNKRVGCSKDLYFDNMGQLVSK